MSFLSYEMSTSHNGTIDRESPFTISLFINFLVVAIPAPLHYIRQKIVTQCALLERNRLH